MILNLQETTEGTITWEGKPINSVNRDILGYLPEERGIFPQMKVKETNRIDAVVNELKKLGANIEATDDGMIIEGPTPLTGGSLKTYGDHRIGMMGAVAALVAKGAVELDDADCIAVSYPTFFEHVEKLVK